MGILGFFRKKHKKAPEKSAAKAESAVVRNGKRVMLANIECVNRGIMELWLDKEGYEVLKVYDDSEVLGSYRKHRPDVVVMSGFGLNVEAFEELMCEHPDARVIMCERKDALDAEEMETLVVKSIRQGAKDFLLLPVEPERLLRSVRSLCG